MAERAGLLKTMPTVEEIVGPTPGQILRRRIFGHRGLMIGGGILLGILLIALLAPVIDPVIARVDAAEKLVVLGDYGPYSVEELKARR